MTCKGCGSNGFAMSKLGPDRCEFCDGTIGGNPPTEAEVAEASLVEEPTSQTCPACMQPMAVGFGLAGGGYGAYLYCETEGCAAIIKAEPQNVET